MRRRIVRAAALGLSLGTFPAAAQQSPALTTIHVGGVFNDDMTPVFYAEKAGLFKRVGLDVQIVGSNSGAAMTAAVISGTYEFGKASLLAAVNAHRRGLPLDVIANAAVYDTKRPFTAFCVATDSTATTGKDFEGTIIGAPSLNDLNQLAVQAWVDQHGGDASKLKFVELPNSTAPPAIAGSRERRCDEDGESALAPGLRLDRARVRGRGLLHIERL